MTEKDVRYYDAWGIAPLPCIYRRDPVPHTGRYRSDIHCRNVRCWFRSYRADRIPEYQKYVRKKAMVPNMWDLEPWENTSRSWKENTKKRHQWG
ncbi:MAG: hypothetical protein J6N77_02210 [Lachnospiraceae bacterium]|nr:hypothetical protein [Lachnospiraceae bacterium]